MRIRNPGGGQTLPGIRHSGAEARTGSEVSGLKSDGQRKFRLLVVLMLAGLTIYLFYSEGVVKAIFGFHVFVLSATVGVKLKSQVCLVGCLLANGFFGQTI